MDWVGFLSATFLLILSTTGLFLLWRWSGSQKSIGWMISLAFFLRIGLGVCLNLALPVWGHDSPTNQAGYVFYDAYRRDSDAFTLAQSGEPIWRAFSDDFSTDQYGGMLALSAFIYRNFSADMHRSWLILIITAFFTAAGTPFLWKTLRQRFGTKEALVGSWLYVLYPESILLGAAQMRDPILIGLGATAFWTVLTLKDKQVHRWLIAAITLIVMAAFSWLMATAVFAALVLWLWIEHVTAINRPHRKTFWWAVLGLLAVVAVGLLWRWLRSAAIWDAYLAERDSGWIQAIFEQIPTAFQLPFLVFYGLLQPVLPAAIFDPSVPLWTGLSTFRAAGWYLILPFLPYAIIAQTRIEPLDKRRLVLWTLGISVIWMLISSLRAGGDMWDNPRYRTLLFPWIALFVSWAWIHAKTHRDAWLGRWFLVEGVFLAFFTHWYIARKIGIVDPLPFGVMIVAIVIISLGILLGGVLLDRYKPRKTSK